MHWKKKMYYACRSPSACMKAKKSYTERVRRYVNAVDVMQVFWYSPVVVCVCSTTKRCSKMTGYIRSQCYLGMRMNVRKWFKGVSSSSV